MDGRRRRGDKRLCQESITFRILVVIPKFYLFVAFRGGPWGGQYKLAGALKAVKCGIVINPTGSVTDGLIGRIQHQCAKIGKSGEVAKPVGSLAEGIIPWVSGRRCAGVGH